MGKEHMHLGEPNQEFMELFAKLPGDPLANRSVHEMRALFTASKKQLTDALSSPQLMEGIKERDIHVKARDGYDIYVKVHEPAKPVEGGSPLVVYYHGGGFCIGDALSETVVARKFVKRYGAVVLNVEYRLAPEHPFPVPINDSWDVLKWASENYKELGADPSKGFVIGGTSAGGNISAVLGFKARDEKLSPPLTGLLLVIPAMGISYKDIPAQYKDEILSYEQNAEAPVLPLRVIDTFMQGFQPDYTSRLHNLFADPVDWSGVPPTVFQICGMDPLRDEAFLAERLMREAGVKTMVQVYPGLPHAFWGFLPTWGPSQQFIDATADTMGWLLEQGGK